MLKETLEKLKQFEYILKKCILDKFNNSIPQNKIDLLNSSDYVIEEELKSLNNGKEIQGKILRNMLHSIIDLKSNKEFTLDNGENITVLYGEDIENEIIELYCNEISKKYKFDIDANNSDLSIASKLRELLGNGFDFNILNFNADYILSLDNVIDFSEEYNKRILSSYIQSSPDNSIASQNENNAKDNITTDTINVVSENNINSTITEDKPIVNNSNSNENKQSILSDEEYKNLCMKFARNEVLTPQEFNLLLMSTPNLGNEDEINKMSNKIANISINEQDKMSRGFTDYSFASYFVIISIIILVTIGFIIL